MQVHKQLPVLLSWNKFSRKMTCLFSVGIHLSEGHNFLCNRSEKDLVLFSTEPKWIRITSSAVFKWDMENTETAQWGNLPVFSRFLVKWFWKEIEKWSRLMFLCFFYHFQRKIWRNSRHPTHLNFVYHSVIPWTWISADLRNKVDAINMEQEQRNGIIYI